MHTAAAMQPVSPQSKLAHCAPRVQGSPSEPSASQVPTPEPPSGTLQYEPSEQPMSHGWPSVGCATHVVPLHSANFEQSPLVVHGAPGNPTITHMLASLHTAPMSAHSPAGHGAPTAGNGAHSPAGQPSPKSQSVDSMQPAPEPPSGTQTPASEHARLESHDRVTHGSPLPAGPSAAMHVPAQHAC